MTNSPEQRAHILYVKTSDFTLKSSDGSASPVTPAHLLVKYHVCENEGEKNINYWTYVGSTISDPAKSLRLILSNIFESKDAMKGWQWRVKFDDRLWDDLTGSTQPLHFVSSSVQWTSVPLSSCCPVRLHSWNTICKGTCLIGDSKEIKETY